MTTTPQDAEARNVKAEDFPEETPPWETSNQRKNNQRKSVGLVAPTLAPGIQMNPEATLRSKARQAALKRKQVDRT
ncbi:MAG: hypothetical protein ACOVNL_01890 [Prochlorococcaceae cyanobacterium]|jgi:hypothetical protein